ncbi:MAG: hypothetical protein ACRCU6_08400 [Fusobacteriaceae bacterium]
MMRIEKYSTPDFKEGLYINLENGEVFATVSSLARMLGKSKQTVLKFLTNVELDSGNQLEIKTAETSANVELDSGNQLEIKTAGTDQINLKETLKNIEIETSAGKRIAKLIPEPIILEAISKYKPDLVKACASAGLRVFLHRLAGFEVTTTATAPLKSDKELLLEAQLMAKDLEFQLAKSQLETLEAKRVMVEKENYILRAINDRPGLERMLEDFQQFNPNVNLLPGTTYKVSLREWMLGHKKIILEGSLFNKFVSKVHGAYKALNHKAPEKEWRQLAKDKSKTLVQVYEIKDYSILDQCYYQTILEQ